MFQPRTRGRIECSSMSIPLCIASLSVFAVLSIASCDKRNDPNPVGSGPTPTTDRTPAAKPAPAPDNSARNVVDSEGVTKTPMDQSQAGADIKITADIRKAILNDKSMSINAQNCKIVTDSRGMVTLRGVVSSQAEKDSIEVMAKQIAGPSHLDNQLEVKAN